MIGRIVEIAGEGRYLSLHRGFLVVSHRGQEVGRTPIDDVAALIGNAHGLSYSNNLLVALAERGCPFVLCSDRHQPVAVLWPVAGHHRQAARIDAQIGASQPVRKRLWKQLVQHKIAMQAAALDRLAQPSAPVRRWVAKVRAGDPGNVEGLAARTYWPLLFGPKFRRDQGGEGVNALLNFGYAVLRSMVARHLMAAGMHPGVPVHHANEGNPMRLVDDLMEPFRPVVDLWVHRLCTQGHETVSPEAKRALGLLPTRSLRVDVGVSPLTLVVQRVCVSLAQVYERERKTLDLPAITADTLAALFEEDVHAQEEEA